MKYNVKAIMHNAHEIARGLIGDYAARMSIALKQAWAEAKNGFKKVSKTVEAYLTENLGLKVWENYGRKRIYIKNAETTGFSDDYDDKCRVHRTTIYYDCIEQCFYHNATKRLTVKAVEKCIAFLKESAKNA